MIFSFCLHPERGANLAQSSPVPASQHPCTTSRVGFPRKPHLGHALDGKGYSYPDFGLHSNSVSDDTSLISLIASLRTRLHGRMNKAVHQDFSIRGPKTSHTGLGFLPSKYQAFVDWQAMVSGARSEGRMPALHLRGVCTL